MLKTIVSLLALLFFAGDLSAQKKTIDQKVDSVLKLMTLEEKIGQMTLVEKNSVHDEGDLASYSIGALLSGAGAKPEENTVEGWNSMVSNFVARSKESRLGIPLLYGIDAIHGHTNVPGATVFPHAIGLGATGDEALVEAIAFATAQELSATNIHWNFSPNLDLPQDIRWGRAYETFTDDPVLASKLGSAYVRGHQKAQSDASPEVAVLSTPKHFLGTGGMIWESSSNKDFHIDQGTTAGSEALLREVYLPPFKAAVDEGVYSVLIGLNAWGKPDAVSEDFIVDDLITADFLTKYPVTSKINHRYRELVLKLRGINDPKLAANKYLVTDVLKGELGFDGFAVSDWYGVYEIEGGDYKAAVTAINAGIDMVMLPFDYKAFIGNVTKAVKRGEIEEARIDDAVRRILRAKFAVGLFDGPAASDAKVIGSPEHQALARRAVASSQVLLKNEGAVLPLSKNNEHIKIVGSAADNVGKQAGAWTVEWQGVDGNVLEDGMSILEGIKEKLGASADIEYSETGEFAEGTQRAKIGIAIVGEKPYAEGWGDKAVPTLDDADLDAIKRLQEVSDTVVVVIVSGRPLFVTGELPTWSAVVASWLPGTQGGGVADVLFGDVPFTGTLPLPWPAYTQQLPIRTSGETADGTPVLFPRGHGLR